jgi:hypothetical protein
MNMMHRKVYYGQNMSEVENVILAPMIFLCPKFFQSLSAAF